MKASSVNFSVLLQRAQTCFDKRETGQARALCEDLLKINKNDPAANFLMYRICAAEQRSDDAIRYAQRCITLKPKHVPFRLAYGVFLARNGRYKDAVDVLTKAHKLAPADNHVAAALADAHELMGDATLGIPLVEPIIKRGEDDVLIATIWARLNIDVKNFQEAIRALTRHPANSNTPPGYFFTLGEAYEKVGDIDRAFEAYVTANARAHRDFNLDEFIDQHRRLVKTFSPALLKRLPRPTHATDLPIFIAGRPRSGTTLIEKILDAHPNVAGVGELPFISKQKDQMNLAIGSVLPYPECMRDVDQNDANQLSAAYLDHIRTLAPKGSTRIVDKHLNNYEYLGMFNVLFPQSHVLHIRRNPLDNCWACFVAAITAGWTMNLRSLGITYRIYERLMEYWRQTLDLPILDVDYEAVVDDQEGWTRKILDFCGLPFDERCLRFYEAARDVKSNQIAAQTLSYNQVRQPIYKSSVNRAAKFEKHLGPLRDALEEGRKIAEQIVADITQ